VQGIAEPLAAGQATGSMLFSINDGNSYRLNVYTTPTTLILKKETGAKPFISKSLTYAENTQFLYQAYWTDQGMGIRAKTIGGTWSAWGTDANTDEVPIASTAQLGARNNASHFNGNYPQFKTLFLLTKASAAEYQSYIEDEGNW
jgi:hypothetical protein